MKKAMNKLTEAQQKIYDSIPNWNWFSVWELPPFSKNRLSQCQKMFEKGYLERTLGDNYSKWYFKKIRL
jgi:hypothetical protein